MRKIFTSLFIFLFLCSCQNEYENNLSSISEQYKEYLNDMAFKNNASFEYLIFEPIKYDTVTMSAYYRRLVSMYEMEFERHKQLIKINTLKMEKALNSMKLAKLVGDKHDIDEASREFESISNNSNKELELLHVIGRRMDSLITLSNSAEVGVNKMYLLQLYFKGVLTNRDGSTENKIDTVYPLFDKDFKFMSMPDVSIDIIED